MLASVRHRVAQLGLEPGPDASACRAAVLLLVAHQVGQSVHRLATLTGEPSEFVARCARRLVDNGVWQEGGTVALWTGVEFDTTSFWADVAVAEGKLCRRIDDSGEFHWAQPGQWWKEFDYFSRPEGRSLVTRYRPRATPPPPSLDDRLVALEMEEPVVTAVAPRRREVEVSATERSFTPRVAAGAVPPAGDILILGSPGLYGDAVWLA
jgi:hypothetical protein